MDLTRRQEIVLLLRGGAATLDDLAHRLGVSTRTLRSDIDHVRRSTGRDERFRVHAPVCLDCGFVFKERARVTAPSRCPRCRSERIDPPRFEIVSR